MDLRSRRTRFYARLSTAVVLGGLALGVGLVVNPFVDRNCPAPSIAGGRDVIGGPFTLVSHEGREVEEADVITGPTLVYFGYTFCPDICPLDLDRNATAIDLLAAEGVDLPGVFITVDPERDTPEVLAEYVDVLHPGFTGLTGTRDQVAAAADAYRVFFRKAGEGEDYLVDHSTFTYLMSPEGLLDYFKRQDSAADIAERTACHIG